MLTTFRQNQNTTSVEDGSVGGRRQRAGLPAEVTSCGVASSGSTNCGMALADVVAAVGCGLVAVATEKGIRQRRET